MGKSKGKGTGTEEAAEEEEEKAQPVPHPLVDISGEQAERKGQAGVDPAPAPAPAPPRKRGRPRKVVPKAEEGVPAGAQQSIAPTDGKKKIKPEGPSSTRNGTSSKDPAIPAVKGNARAPLRREGSRRKSEPRRAAD